MPGGRVGGGFHLPVVGDVRGHGEGSAAGGFDLTGRGGEAGLAAGEQDEIRAACGESPRGSPSDARAGSGDDDGLCHGVVSFPQEKPGRGWAARRVAVSSMRAWTNAWGRLPRSCR